jgi:lipopolysaccharide transport system permease protein
MLVFTIVFSRFAHIRSGDTPYPVFVLSGLVPWQFFSQGVMRCTRSLVDERYLLSRLYIPRMIPPLAAVLGGVFDLAIGFLVLAAVIFYYDHSLSVRALGGLLYFVPILLVTFAVGLLLSVLNVRFRDVSLVLPFFMQLWLLLSPVAYPHHVVPAGWQVLHGFDPLAPYLDAFRHAVLQNYADAGHSSHGIATGVAVMVVSIVIFHRTDRVYPDIV